MPADTAAYMAVQGAPGQVEVDVGDAVEVSSIVWWQIVLVPLILALVTMVGSSMKSWFDSRSNATATLIDGYVSRVDDLSKQVGELVVRQAADRQRIATLERRNARSELRGDRMQRIAHRALDRVEDQASYLIRRDAERDRHDPDHTLTPWVPVAPAHLLDLSWTAQMRADLEEYFAEITDSSEESVGG